VWFALATASVYAQQLTPKDPGARRAQFVRVAENVQLEVLDWGGKGRSCVLLAGSGNSAHVFDEFAPKLTDVCHVYGITRRGYGASTLTESGYNAERLAEDVVAVLDFLNLTAPVLMGHSLGGHELTAVASTHPGRVSGLVYMDSTADPTFDWKPYQELSKKLPRATPSVQPSPEDRRSVPAYREWLHRSRGIAFPDSEVQHLYVVNTDGTVGPYKTPVRVPDAIFAGMRKPDYSRIRVPVLAFFTLPGSLEQQVQRYRPENIEQRAVVEQLYAADVAYARRAEAILRAGVPEARVIELPGANHYIFLSNEQDVLREIRAFLTDLL
jgi:pimeloyl-ACP methyl ester carboxylesterase